MLSAGGRLAGSAAVPDSPDQAIDTVYETYRYKTTEKADWSKMSKTQVEIIRWLDG
jgi:hypothetical protein